MKNKKIITPENYKEIMLKRGIISCWILLAICLIIKICGGNYFAIVCNSENFINFCKPSRYYFYSLNQDVAAL